MSSVVGLRFFKFVLLNFCNHACDELQMSISFSQPHRFFSACRLWVLVSCLATSSVVATEPPVTAVAFAFDGMSVVAASQAGLREFDWPQLKLKRTIYVAAANLHCVAFSSDGHSLAVGGGNPSEKGVVQCFAWPDGTVVSTIRQHTDSVRSVAWADSARLISASQDREIKLCDQSGNSTASLKKFRGHSRAVSDVLLLEDGKTLVTAGDDQSVRVWDLESAKLIRSLNQHTTPIHSLALRPNGRGLPMVASAADDRTIRFWQPTIGRMVRYIRLDSAALCIAWLDENRIAASCVDGRVRIVDVNEVKLLKDLEGVDGWAYAIAVHPKDGSMVVGGSDGQLRRIKIKDTATQ